MTFWDWLHHDSDGAFAARLFIGLPALAIVGEVVVRIWGRCG